MTVERFEAIDGLDEQAFGQLESLSPDNPFCTLNYARARQAQGSTPWILALRSRDSFVTACAAFERIGRLNRTLEIPSTPALSRDDAFWNGLADFCRAQGISRLTLDSFASLLSCVPAIGRSMRERDRTEYVLDLRQRRLAEGLSENHARNIRRAQKLGVRVEKPATTDAMLVHTQLMTASVERRIERGEKLSRDLAADRIASFTRCGAGELFQAYLADEPVSSILVLTARSGAYYHSAGTSPVGMKSGASQYLVHSVAEELQHRGFSVFNLGGAHCAQIGLVRFKSGFGARATSMKAAELDVPRSIRSVARSTLNALWRHV